MNKLIPSLLAAALAGGCFIQQAQPEAAEPAGPAASAEAVPEASCADACARILECGFYDDAAACEAECQAQGYDAATRAEVADGTCVEIAAMAEQAQADQAAAEQGTE